MPVHHVVAVSLWKFIRLFRSRIHMEDRLLPPFEDITNISKILNNKYLKIFFYFFFLVFYFLTQGDIRVSDGKNLAFHSSFFLGLRPF